MPTVRSGVADHAILLITLYNVIFQWWLYTHDSDQNAFIEQQSVFKLLNLPPYPLMLWNGLTLPIMLSVSPG